MNSSENSSEPTSGWYIVKRPQGYCEIIAVSGPLNTQETPEYWGPFADQGTAIARRIGLIRAGKCQPLQPES